MAGMPSLTYTPKQSRLSFAGKFEVYDTILSYETWGDASLHYWGLHSICANACGLDVWLPVAQHVGGGGPSCSATLALAPASKLENQLR